jgi:hypothetical protein
MPMDSSTFPSTPGEFAHLILESFLRPAPFVGATEVEHRVAEDRFRRGVCHCYHQLFYMTQLKDMREFCWSLAQFVICTASQSLEDDRPYLFIAVCRIMAAAGLRLRSAQDEMNVPFISKFYDLVGCSPSPDRLAVFLIDHWE